MTQRRDRSKWIVGWRLLPMLLLCVAAAAIVTGCSAEGRYRIKTILFTGVPPLHGDPDAAETTQADPEQAAKAEQQARQRQHREAMVSPYWQHGPFAAGECSRCHNLSQSKSFLGSRDIANQPSPVASTSAPSRLALPPEQLCTTCHIQHGAAFARELGLAQHLPAAAGACTGCHHPHQSLRRYMLLKADNVELCGGCHSAAALAPGHTSSQEQDCIGCHNAHVGINDKLLRSDANELTLLYGGSRD